MTNMDQAMQGADVLPDKKQRQSYIYVVIYRDDAGLLTVQECPDRGASRVLVNSLGLEKVLKVYRVSQVVELKQKTVITF